MLLMPPRYALPLPLYADAIMLSPPLARHAATCHATLLRDYGRQYAIQLT